MTTDRTSKSDDSKVAASKAGSSSAAPSRAVYEVVSFVSNFLWTFILFLVSVLFVALIIFPLSQGAKPATVLTQSMVPTFNPGDVVVSKSPVNLSTVKIGDVVEIYEKSGRPETFSHRVMSITHDSSTPTGYIFHTQGDNNDAADEPIRGERIKGVLLNWPKSNHLAVVPKIGHIRSYPYHVLAFFVVFLVFVLVASWFEERRKKQLAALSPKKATLEEENAQLRSEVESLRKELTSLRGNQSS